jgi:hypothetical protein
MVATLNAYHYPWPSIRSPARGRTNVADAIALKIVGGACVVALSFWITLKLLNYQESTTATSTDSAVAENEASHGSAPARRTIRLFDEPQLTCGQSRRRLERGRGVPMARARPFFLDDRSKIYGLGSLYRSGRFEGLAEIQEPGRAGCEARS